MNSTNEVLTKNVWCNWQFVHRIIYSGLCTYSIISTIDLHAGSRRLVMVPVCVYSTNYRNYVCIPLRNGMTTKHLGTQLRLLTYLRPLFKQISNISPNLKHYFDMLYYNYTPRHEITAVKTCPSLSIGPPSTYRTLPIRINVYFRPSISKVFCKFSRGYA